MAYKIGMQAIEYYGSCYQILFAVHEAQLSAYPYGDEYQNQLHTGQNIRATKRTITVLLHICKKSYLHMILT